LLLEKLWVLPCVLFLGPIVVLFLVTPTLNLDDLLYAETLPDLISRFGYPKVLQMFFLNEDVGVNQLRTYGLSRAIQVVTTGIFGESPLPSYLFVLLVHFASAFIIYRLLLLASGDQLTGLFASVAWIASPTVLPLLKVQHHFLYLIAPYYALLAWTWLAAERKLPFAVGIVLLTATWLLGEGAIIPMAFAVTFMAWHHRRSALAAQGAVSGVLLIAYVAYQFAFVRNPSTSPRFQLHAPRIEMIGSFLSQLGQSGRAILGLAYQDAELGSRLGGIGSIGWPLVSLFVFAGTIFLISSTSVPSDGRRRRMDVSVALVVIALLSLALYFLFALFSAGVVAVRYTAAFYLLAPIGVIAIVATMRRRVSGVRFCSAIVAAFSLSLTLLLLWRSEVLVSAPNRAAFAREYHEKAIVLRHNGIAVSGSGNVGGAYPGLISPLENNLPNPMRSAWTVEPAFRLYKKITVGAGCRILENGKVEVFYQNISRGSFNREDVSVVGLKDRVSSELLSLKLEEVCDHNEDGAGVQFSERELFGEWAVFGGHGTIESSGGGLLTVVDENKNIASGRFDEVLSVDKWKVTGRLSKDKMSILWSNGAVWKRREGRKPTATSIIP